MSECIPEAVAEVRPVGRACQDLAGIIDSLHHTINSLEEILKPVLFPPMPTPQTGGLPKEEISKSPLELVIIEVIYKTTVEVGKIENIIARIQV